MLVPADTSSPLGTLLHLLRSPSRAVQEQGEAVLQQNYHMRPRGALQVSITWEQHLPGNSSILPVVQRLPACSLNMRRVRQLVHGQLAWPAQLLLTASTPWCRTTEATVCVCMSRISFVLCCVVWPALLSDA